MSLSERVSLAVEGLSKLRLASLLMIIASILGVAAVVVMVLTVLGRGIAPAAMGPNPHVSPPRLLFGVLGNFLQALISGVVVVLVAFVIELVAVFAFLIPSFRRLKDYSSSLFGTSSTLISVGFVGGLILVVLGLGALIASVLSKSFGGLLSSIALLIISFILMLIGNIGLIVGCFRLREAFGETLFLAAGILLIIGIILSFIPYTAAASMILDFVSWILVFVASGSALRKLKAMQTASESVASKAS